MPKTDFCIICGQKFDDSIVPSLEHIIPEALGNEKLTTECVCRKCNNNLGSNVDCYLTDYIIVKFLRSQKLDKDKDIQLFDSNLVDDKGDTYLIRDNKPEIVPKIEIDKESKHVHMEVSSLSDAKKHARRILKRRFKLSEDEINGILEDPERFIVGDTQSIKVEALKQDATIDFARFKLAVLKIAYEYATEKIGDSYTSDPVAIIFRSYLKAGCDGKKEFSQSDYDVFGKYCSLGNKFTDILKDALKACEGKTTSPVLHFTQIISNEGNQLLCTIRILNSDFLTFNVLISEDASRYKKKDFCTVILEDGFLYED